MEMEGLPTQLVYVQFLASASAPTHLEEQISGADQFARLLQLRHQSRQRAAARTRRILGRVISGSSAATGGGHGFRLRCLGTLGSSSGGGRRRRAGRAIAASISGGGVSLSWSGGCSCTCCCPSGPRRGGAGAARSSGRGVLRLHLLLSPLRILGHSLGCQLLSCVQGIVKGAVHPLIA